MRAFLLLAASLLLIQTSSFGQAQRRVLVEHFTQASCGPCAAQNPAFNAMLFANYEKVVPLKYQVSWPGYDPMYEHNPVEIDARVSYYGVNAVPNVRIDGTIDAGTSGSVTVTQLNNAYAVSTPLEMELTHSLSADLSTMYITCTVTNVGTEAFDVANTVVRVAVIEQELIFPEPPGSTNEVDFYNVMRKMLPDQNGTPLPAIAAGESFEIEFEYTLPDYIYRYDQLGAVAFVQTNGSRVVHQSTISETLGAPAGFGDLGLDLTTQGPAAYCEYDLIPGAELTNESDTEVTSFELELVVNGTVAGTENWTGSLMPGQSIVVTFPPMTVDPGQTDVELNLNSVNGQIDYNKLNQLINTETFRTFSDVPFAEAIQETFESTANLGTPLHTIIESDNPYRFGVVNASVFGSSTPVGGFGASAKSIFVNFFSWSAVGAEAHLLFDKIDLSERENARLRFDYAFANYPGYGPDFLKVFASTDCGDTWTQLFSGSNTQYNTANPTESLFVPTASQWDTLSIDLSAYDGVEELNIRFTAQSGWGNNLFLDNIEVVSSMVSSVDEPGVLAGMVDVYPNPATNLVNIDIQLAESSEVNVMVFDAAGKLVATLANGASMASGAHNLSWRPELPGLYMVRVATERGAVTQRISVIR